MGKGYGLWQYHMSIVSNLVQIPIKHHFQEYADIDLELGGSGAAHLVNTLPNVGDSNYHIVMDNFFTSPELLRHLISKQIATTGRAKRMEKAPLQDLGKITNESRGTSDVVIDVSSNISAVRWKDNKIVNALCTFPEKKTVQSVKRFFKKQNP